MPIIKNLCRPFSLPFRMTTKKDPGFATQNLRRIYPKNNLPA